MIKTVFVIVCLAYVVFAAPQAPPADEKPSPYEYTYEVKDAEKMLFHNKNESGDEQGKVTGRYSVWLPDGRLQIVEYTVDGESGFVPKITYEDNANPL